MPTCLCRPCASRFVPGNRPRCRGPDVSAPADRRTGGRADYCGRSGDRPCITGSRAAARRSNGRRRSSRRPPRHSPTTAWWPPVRMRERASCSSWFPHETVSGMQQERGQHLRARRAPRQVDPVEGNAVFRRGGEGSCLRRSCPEESCRQCHASTAIVALRGDAMVSRHAVSVVARTARSRERSHGARQQRPREHEGAGEVPPPAKGCCRHGKRVARRRGARLWR